MQRAAANEFSKLTKLAITLKTTIMLTDRQIEQQIIKELTNRQLIIDYRKTVIFLNDVIEHYNTGSKYHLGERIFKVVNSARLSVAMLKNELEARNYVIADLKNIPALITQKNPFELSKDRIAKREDFKAAQIEAEKTSPLFIANGTEISQDQIKKLILNNGLDLAKLIDAVIDLNGFIGVGLISLGDSLQKYCHNKIKPQGEY
jgi:hypothetical protein